MNSMRGLVQQKRDTNPDPINERRSSERDAPHPSYREHPGVGAFTLILRNNEFLIASFFRLVLFSRQVRFA